MGGFIISFLSGYGAIIIPLNQFSLINKEVLQQQFEKIKDFLSLSFHQIRQEKLHLNDVMQQNEGPKKQSRLWGFLSSKSEKKEVYNIKLRIQAAQKMYEDNY